MKKAFKKISEYFFQFEVYTRIYTVYIFCPPHIVIGVALWNIVTKFFICKGMTSLMEDLFQNTIGRWHSVSPSIVVSVLAIQNSTKNSRNSSSALDTSTLKELKGYNKLFNIHPVVVTWAFQHSNQCKTTTLGIQKWWSL